ncbi:MAG: sodium:solute symporter family protein [Geminicoccaceae bacterium]
METKIIWLFVFVVLYWAYCIFWGIKGAMTARTASDYFIAGRRISFWVFVLAATATSFSGWIFVGHPGMLYSEGFPYAYLSFYAIAVPFTGLLFLKRQWIIGKRFGFVTPGEMLSYYFRSDAIRLLVILVALVFSVPWLGVQLRAAGLLFHGLSDGLLSVDVGMWGLAAVLFFYVAAGGLRAVAKIAALQGILLVAGIVIIGVVALNEVGGWTGLAQSIGLLAGTDTGLPPDGSSHDVAVPGVIQLVPDGASAAGGAWTGVMILTAMLALMGIQAAPAFSMWAFASRDPAPFASQQVWASSLVVGIILLLLAAVQGMSEEPALGGLSDREGRQAMLVPQLIDLMSDTAPWLVGLLAVCALAALQAAAAFYMSTAGAMLTRDLIRRFLMPNVGHGLQKLIGRIGVGVIVLLALLVATASSDALVLVGTLALAYGFQLWPALIAVCYWPFLTRTGVVLDLIAGLVAVTLTDMPASVGIEVWGRWPWTIHSAGWGIVCNLAVALLVSAITRDDMDRKMEFHNFVAQHAMLPPDRRKLIPIAWIATLAWFFFAGGPGAVVGNWIFGNPDEPTTWMLGMPPIWAWQLLWWALGVVMMWFLAYVMQMSTVPETDVASLADDIAEIEQARI